MNLQDIKFELEETPERFEDTRPRATNRELLMLICILTISIFALGNLYRAYERSQIHSTEELTTVIGTNQKIRTSHAPEIGY